jgi:ribose 5-phosphate isomerase A
VSAHDAGEWKRAAAGRALEFVADGMTLGLGTGTTAEAFLDLLAERVRAGLRIACAATSNRTEALARSLGIPLDDLDQLAPLDLAVDGADEADRQLHLIKGGGGALLREKIVAASARRMIVIADESKLVERLGRFPLPVEVTRFGHVTTARRIAEILAVLGYAQPSLMLRVHRDAPFVTDGGNVIYDCAFGAIADAPQLATALEAIPGVVEHGLFIGLATTLVIAGANGVDILNRPPSP